MRKIYLALLFCLPFFIFSQERKYGFDLDTYLDQVQEKDLVPLLVEGDDTNLNSFIKELGGTVRLQIETLYSIEIPANKVELLSQSDLVKQIEFSLSKGVSLNDTMLIHTNVDSIANAYSPISRPYTGKGVVVGIIDSGIETEHGDFKDSTGKTRIQFIWDQRAAYNPNQRAGNYTYGVEWDSAAINNGNCTHDDNPSEFGHGSMVTGAATSNGNATGNYKGVAPDAVIVSVATDFGKPNWLQTVAEAADYIYKKADSLGLPCVINASIGTYSGSHDGQDIAARMIDFMIKQKSGRAFVAACGNAGQQKFHTQLQSNNDTSFTWFDYSSGVLSGAGGVYFEVWSDTSDFNHMQFSVGADEETSPNNYTYKGRTNFSGISSRLNTVYLDSIMLGNQRIAYIETYAELSQGRYKLEVAIRNPQFTNYLYRFETIGIGKADIWSSFTLFRTSNFKISNLPTTTQYPRISKYAKADSLQSMVSSFTCLPSVITVGNYTNRNTYPAANGVIQNMGLIPGKISLNSSLGPNRKGYLKPDIVSAGDIMMSSGRIATMNQLVISQPYKISADSMHMRNGGTSMAAPTVTGMVALYLEMCSNANYNQIKTDLIASARTDLYATNLPNPTYGNGKADGFQFLSTKAFEPRLSFSLQSPLCIGDTVNIATASAYQKYLWSNGDTVSSTTTGTSSFYYTDVLNNNGCNARTDSLLLNFGNIPNKAVLSFSQDTIFANGSNGMYQWFLNNQPINGQTNPWIKINATANYHCSISDSTSLCKVFSDTLLVQHTGVNSFKMKNVKIFPNPTNGIVYIQNKESELIHLRLRNTQSKVVFEKTVKFHNNKLDIDHLSTGIYFLEVNTKDASETIKLLKR